MSDYEFHPIANMFPLIDGEDWTRFVDDVRAHGLKHDIVLHEGQILDGRNRYRACVEAGIAPRFRTLGDGEDPWSTVWSLNAERRHLEKGQAVVLRIKFLRGSEDWTKGREAARESANAARAKALRGNDNAATQRGLPAVARSEKQTSAKVHPTVSAKAKETVAQSASVSPRTAQSALTLEKKSPALFEKVAQGKMTLHAATSQVKHEEARAKVHAQAAAAPERAVIRKQDAHEFIASLKLASVDLLITDPPYMTDVEDIDAFARGWVPAALARVKRTGRAYICTGAYPDELRAYLNVLRDEPVMKLANVLVWTYRNTIGPSPKMDYKLNWQSVFYLRGPDAPPLDCPIMLEQFTVQDINAPDGRQGDRYHAWQKPDELAERLIRHSTQKGARVVDPFAGTGTFILAAARLGRHAEGCDISPENIAIALERGCANGDA